MHAMISGNIYTESLKDMDACLFQTCSGGLYVCDGLEGFHSIPSQSCQI